MGHELCGLTACLWRSCGSARKTSRIARGCRLCRRCHISRYRQTVCSAARSETCDQRERGALPRRRRARRGRSTSMAGPPWSSAVRRWLRPPACVCRRRSAGRMGGASRRKGCTGSSRAIAAASARSISERRAACCSRSRPTIRASPVDEPKETLGNAIKLPPWYESRRAGIVAALAPLR